MNRTAAYLLTPDDPRLTAFALGELEGEDCAWVAAAVSGNPELRFAVEEIRHAASEIGAALASEPLPEVSPLSLISGTNGHRSSILRFPAPTLAASSVSAPAQRVPAAARSGYVSPSRHRNPQLSYFWVMTIAAACFLVVVFVGERRFTAEEDARTTRAAQIAATERARRAAAAASAMQRAYLELDISNVGYARAIAPDTAVAERTSYFPAEQRPTSSFPIDVATTSYGDVVRAIAARQLPPVGSVRIEEMLNTFAYDYPGPAAGDDAPFAAALEAAEAPWAPRHRLVRIGLKGRGDAYGAALPIARNVSIVVEFNPATVQAYRLIGYEKSPIVGQDALSSGRLNVAEVRSGHTVTALYEVIPVAGPAGEPTADGTRLLNVRIAYTTLDGMAARPLEFPLDDRGASFGDASGDFKFAAAVAGFGMILRDPKLDGSLTIGSVIAWAEQGVALDATGRRREFVGLVREAGEFLR